MTSTLERTRTLVSYEATCDHHECRTLTQRIYTQLNVPNYSDGVSLLPVPQTIQQWRNEHRTARKRANRATRLGYRFAIVDNSKHSDDIYNINTSKQERQGRPMSAGYQERNNHGQLPDYPCDRHRINTYGVLQCDVLYAYLTLYRLGELALVSMILGHGDHLPNDIMYLLFQGVVEDQAGQGGTFYYNTWQSGTDGLRYFKTKLGFVEGDVEWVLQ